MVELEPGYHARWWHVFGSITRYLSKGWDFACIALCILMAALLMLSGIFILEQLYVHNNTPIQGVFNSNVAGDVNMPVHIPTAAAVRDQHLVEVEYKSLDWDTACFPRHVCNQRSWFYDLDTSAKTSFSVVGGAPSRSAGTGSILMQPTDLASGAQVNIMLENVAYMPDQPHNLLSHSTMRKHGFIPDFEGLTVTHGDYVFKLGYDDGFFPFSDEPPDPDELSVAASVGELRDTENWRYVDSEFEKYAGIYGNSAGKFTHELFYAANNRMGPAVWDGDSFEHSWVGEHFYGNPVYQNAFITKTLEKALHDFELSPDNTSFFFVLPDWRDAPWYALLSQFQIVHKYPGPPENTEIFTAPASQVYSREGLRPAGEEGGGYDRVFIQGIPWPVILVFKDKHTVTRMDPDWVFHARMGHPGYDVVRTIRDQGWKTGLDLTGNTAVCPKFCSVCQIMNATKPPAGKVDHEYATDPYELIFSDVFGPVNPVSSDGYRYAIHFTDAATRKTKVYFMRTKDESLDRFIDFLAEVESDGYSVRALTIRTDNDQNYVAGKFARFCKDHAVRQETTAPYVHTNAAVAERLWRTLVGMTRAFLKTSGLGDKYWPLIMKHAEYVYNRRPHKSLGGISPNEKMTGEQQDLSKLRILGSVAYAFIDPTLRGKLGHRAVQGVYVGHEEKSPCILVLLPEEGKIIRSGRVRIVEDLDQQGIIVSKRDYKHQDFLSVKDEWAELPANYSGKENITGVHKVTGHRIWYDDAEDETYALVKVVTDDEPDGIWVDGIHFIGKSSDDTNLSKLESYLKTYYVHNSVNPYFPIFTHVKVKTGTKLEPAMIMSTDVNSKNCYKVKYADQDLEIQDVSKGRVVFPDVAAAIAGIQSDLATYVEPASWKEAQTYPDKQLWIDATWREINSIIEKKVLQLLDWSEIPEMANIITSRVLYKLKRKADGSRDIEKARLILQGFLQIHGLDYFDTFAPVSQVLTVRLVLILAVQFGLTTHHVDVKTAFLNSEMKEEVYVKLPDGLSIDGKQYGKVLKSIYGLKQAAHDWYETQDKFLLGHDKRLKKSETEPCLYYIWTNELKVVISTHVDDYVIGTDSPEWYSTFVAAFSKEYEINDLGIVEHVLQMKVEWTEDGVLLSQRRHIDDLAILHNMTGSKAVQTPMEHGLSLKPSTAPTPDLPYRNLLGSLWWIVRNTRPDAFYVVAYMAKFSSSFDGQHFAALKRILQYLIHTSHYKLKFERQDDHTGQVRVYAFSDRERFPQADQYGALLSEVETYTDSDWANDKLDRKSVSGYMSFLFGNPLGWGSKKQTTVALSSAEAEYYALTDACKETAHITNLLSEIFDVVLPIPVMVDNIGAGYMAEKAVNNKRTKHMDIRFHWIRHVIKEKLVELFHVPTADNIADIMTKALPPQTFMKFVKRIFKFGSG